jgi:hypothetical protein
MTIRRRVLAVSKLKIALAALLAVLSIPAVAEAASTLALPTRGKLDQFGHVLLTVTYSCPASTSPADALLWLYSSQNEPTNFAAGDTAVAVTCDGKRRRYRANLGPNIGEPGIYVPGTVFVEAFLGYGADTIHASDSAYIVVQ